jgi:hypothetical protein
MSMYILVVMSFFYIILRIDKDVQTDTEDIRCVVINYRSDYGRFSSV